LLYLLSGIRAHPKFGRRQFMRISDIELYHYPATRSARVKWLLHELVGDEFKVNRIDLYS
jgi:hypothetical protein